jgi:hypothetical protein
MHYPTCLPDIPLVTQEPPDDENLPIQTITGPSDKSVPWPLTCNADGFPIFPSIVHRTLPEIKQIVRSFLSLTYRLYLFSLLYVLTFI